MHIGFANENCAHRFRIGFAMLITILIVNENVEFLSYNSFVWEKNGILIGLGFIGPIICRSSWRWEIAHSPLLLFLFIYFFFILVLKPIIKLKLWDLAVIGDLRPKPRSSLEQGTTQARENSKVFE